MVELRTYRVNRPLHGDRFYAAGDLRQMLPADATELLRLGALEPVLDKAETAPANKGGRTVRAKG